MVQLNHCKPHQTSFVSSHISAHGLGLPKHKLSRQVFQHQQITRLGRSPAAGCELPLHSRRYHAAPRVLRQPVDSYPKQSPRPADRETMKAAKFSELGATRTVKIVVIVVVSILGTMETIFYAKLGWRWWKGESVEERPEVDEVSGQDKPSGRPISR